MPRPSKRKKRPPDKQTNAFLGKDLDYEGWKQIGKCDNMKFSKSLKIYEGIFKFYECPHCDYKSSEFLNKLTRFECKTPAFLCQKVHICGLFHAKCVKKACFCVIIDVSA